MMKSGTRFFAIPFVAVAMTFAAASLSAQQTVKRDTTIKPVTPTVLSTDSASARATSELEVSVAQLALSLQAMAQRIATDPQLKIAAVKLASSLVATAQQLVSDNTVTVESALKIAADRISAVQRALPPAAQTPPPPKPPASR